MDIYHYDRETGAYLGPGIADRDPKSPARWIVPAYATAEVPPPAMAGNLRIFRDGVWGYVAVSDPDEEPSPEPVPPDLVAYAAELRWQAETSGCKFNGWPVKTDAESQGKITSERLAVEAGVRADTDAWKFGDGQFRVLTNVEFIELSNTVRAHVRDCFAREAEVLGAIAGGLGTSKEEVEVAFYDVASPWPSSGGDV